MARSFSHPELVLEALKYAKHQAEWRLVPSGFHSTLEELMAVELVVRVVPNGGRDRARMLVKLTDAGQERLRRANRAALEIASAPL